jgi:hypothetical protein
MSGALLRWDGTIEFSFSMIFHASLCRPKVADKITDRIVSRQTSMSHGKPECLKISVNILLDIPLWYIGI